MKFLSVCSGIEAASVAWHPLGWESVAYSEIEPFPCKVLQHHYPTVPNLGDMTKFKEWPDADVDVFVGGTPCQSFSVAGLRKGLDDPRGNLMLTYLAIAKRYRPNWLVWENVPGVLSSADGRDFGSLLGGLAILGYGFAYRVLDAQYFGVAQRRKRVFVVGYLGNWRPAAAVLFERHSLQGHPAPSREKGKSFAPTIKASVGTGGVDVEHPMVAVLQPEISPALKARDHKGPSSDGDGDGAILVPMQPIPLNTMNCFRSPDADASTGCGIGEAGEAMFTISKTNSHAVAQPIALAENTIGRKPENGGNGDGFTDGGPMYTLNATGVHGVAQPIAFSGQMSNPQTDVDMTQTLGAKNPMAVAQAMAVRRLTPVECERLQGFGDSYTDIQPKGKATPDGPRYKALGNSMAVPVMAWIGKRIQEVDAICKTQQNT
jgi:DNA (cytosine-5)-methyltransferase 1